MLTVDDYGDIRRAHRNGISIKQIAREFEHSRNTIRKVLANAEPNPIPQVRNRTAPILGPFFAIIDQILRDDESAPPKQRHTAAQVRRRLRDEHGYHGGYAQVQRYLFRHRRREQETFIPLGHLPGQRIEADFGHIHVDFPDGRKKPTPTGFFTLAASRWRMIIGYASVSTTEQNLGLDHDDLKPAFDASVDPTNGTSLSVTPY